MKKQYSYKTKNIIINGRFLTKPLAGVQRTAYEMTKALDDLINENPALLKQYSYTILYSGDIINPINLNRIKIVKKGWFTGNLWEQLELPVYSMGCLLINMCSIAPVLKSKQVLFLHDASFFVNPQFFSAGFRRWYKFATPLIAKFCRQIVTVSNFSKNELAKHGRFDPNKITVIYNGVDHMERFSKGDNNFQNKIIALKPYCLAVSSLGLNKNFKGLSAALKLVDFKGFNMLIAGGEVKVLRTSLEAKEIHFLGYVSNEELITLYENASLFIFPSFYEGFGIPPLEAMSLGCPVIASKTSSIPEVLEDACNYFDPHSQSDMAAKINAVLHDEQELNRLKRLGYSQAKKYRWKSSALRLQHLIIAKYA